MDAVGSILAEKERDEFPWAAGVTLAVVLHLAVLGAFLASSMAQPLQLVSTRTVAVRILSAGSIRGAEAARAAAPEPVKPRIEKPPEEAPPPPSEKAVLLPAKEEKRKKKPTPAPASSVPAPRGPEVSLPSSGENSSAGSAAVPAGSGGTSGIGGAQFDQPDFKYSYYVERMVLAISTNWFNPTQHVPIHPVVRFRIERDGTVNDPQIEKSSGLPFVDRAALRAVMASSPLPPLPADYAGSYLGVHLVFE